MGIRILIPNKRSRTFYQSISCISIFSGNYESISKREFTSNSVKPVKMNFSIFDGDTSLSDKVPVIIMHGLFGSKTNWYSLAKVINKKTQKKVYVVDARNHGDSPHSDDHSYIHLSEDIKYFMDEHGIEKVAAIGHSMGGRAFMTFALQNSPKVQSLTVVDVSPIGTPQSMKGMEKIFKEMDNIKPITDTSLSNARRMVEIQLAEALGSKTLSSFLSMNIAANEKGQFSWKINLKSLVKNYYPNITVFPIKEGKFNGPTKFICGEQSDFVNFDDIDEIKRLFPKASFINIPNAGHWVHAEQPIQFLEAACKFINSAKS